MKAIPINVINYDFPNYRELNNFVILNGSQKMYFNNYGVYVYTDEYKMEDSTSTAFKISLT